MAEEITYFEELHESHLAEATKAHRAKLAAQAEAIREELQLDFNEALATKAQEYDTTTAKLQQEAAMLQEEVARGEQTPASSWHGGARRSRT